MHIKSYPARVILYASFIGLLNSGCQKHSDDHRRPNKSAATGCNIDSVISYGPNDRPYPILVYKVNYNELGNPVSVVNTDAHAGNPNYFLQYDAHNRLIGLLGPAIYPDTGYYRWNKYGYNDKNEVVKDTSYYLGELRHITYRYDPLGRMVLETGSILTHGDSTYQIVYTYDANGNRVRSGVSYDSKPSVFGTHPVWMFLAKDYSVNNYFGPWQYNSYNLPTRFNAHTGLDLFPFAYGYVRISYTCP